MVPVSQGAGGTKRPVEDQTSPFNKRKRIETDESGKNIT